MKTPHSEIAGDNSRPLQRCPPASHDIALRSQLQIPTLAGMQIRQIGLDDPTWGAYWDYWCRGARLLGGPTANQLDGEIMHARRSSMPDDERPLLWGAFAGDDLVGIMQTRIWRHITPLSGDIDIKVLPEHGRRGVGSALLDLGEQELQAAGVAAPEGFAFHALAGDLAYFEAGVQFALTHGYRIVQKEIVRELALPTMLDTSHDEDYRIDVIEGEPPKEWLPGLVVMKERMATDAPHDDSAPIVEAWDVERARTHFRPVTGHTTYYAAAFAPDGSMAGYTQLGCDDDGAQRAILHQADTLVLADHRGHGLGASLKAAAISLAQGRRPWLRISRTTNAASNAPMIAINERLGFEIAGEEFAFAKKPI